jgi:hypothetical protein
MPTYAGQLTEEQVLQLIAYIKSLNEVQPGPEPHQSPTPAPQPAQTERRQGRP